MSAGPVQLESMSGDAVVEASAAIALVGRTVSGDLRVRAPRLDGLDASTTSGDVRVEADLAAGNRHAISSVSGDVDVVTGSPVRLEAQTIAGDVRANGPHATEGGRGRRTLVVGNGSVGLSVRTTSGDVRLRVLGGLGSTVARASGRPAAPAVPVAPAVPQAPAAPQAPAVPAAPPVLPCCRSAEPIRARGRSRSRLPSRASAPRPISDDDTQAWNAPEPAIDRREAERLDVLRALERGDMDVETASRRLEALDEAGPRSFRGWC